jgi:hypothetical protein
MGWVAPAVAIAGTVISAYGQYRQGQAYASAAEYNAQMARYEADYQLEKSKREEEEHRQKVRKLIGQQTVKGAAAGATGTGSDFSILLDTLTQAELDAAVIRYGGQVGAWRGRAEAGLLEHQAKQGRIASFLDPAGTILSAAGQFDYSKLTTTKSPLASTYRWSPKKPSGMGSSTR